jgi:hypothetical protein
VRAVAPCRNGPVHPGRNFVAQIPMSESGAQLRDVMRAYGLPLPLRLIDARVLTATRATVIRRLALMNPSTLAQIIPATRQKQTAAPTRHRYIRVWNQ